MQHLTLGVAGLVLMGLAAAQRRSDVSLRQRVGWAPRFDGGTVTAVVAYAVAGLLTAPHHEKAGLALFLTPFLAVAVVLFRQYFVLATEGRRRKRDLANFALIALPSVGGLCGAILSVEAFLWLSLPGLVVGVVCVPLLLYDVVQSFRTRRLLVPDITTSVLGITLGVTELFLFLFAVAPTASNSGIAN